MLLSECTESDLEYWSVRIWRGNFLRNRASVETRLRSASAVQRSAARIADRAFARILSEREMGMALFTASGTGADKTTSIHSTGQTAGLLTSARVIYDSNFNS